VGVTPSTQDFVTQAAQSDMFEIQSSKMALTAHKDAVSLFQRYGKGGDDASLKQWAATTAPALERHLQMAQNLNK